ncbi:MAG: YfiR family protein [Cytophagales bacterium]|nr:YfiR family protein [Cytophagales bacterium]
MKRTYKMIRKSSSKFLSYFSNLIIFEYISILFPMNKYFFTVTFTVCTYIALAQEVNYKVHAMFMYHFTKYVEWPDAKKSGDFVIGVVGSSDINKELETIAATKKAGAQSIVVKKISASDAATCHMVFIPSSQSSNLDDVLQSGGGKPVLIVSEKNGLCKKGSNMNFVIVDDKLKFEINKASIENNGLKISGELLKLGIVL